MNKQARNFFIGSAVCFGIACALAFRIGDAWKKSGAESTKSAVRLQNLSKDFSGEALRDVIVTKRHADGTVQTWAAQEGRMYFRKDYYRENEDPFVAGRPGSLLLLQTDGDINTRPGKYRAIAFRDSCTGRIVSLLFDSTVTLAQSSLLVPCFQLNDRLQEKPSQPQTREKNPRSKDGTGPSRRLEESAPR